VFYTIFALHTAAAQQAQELADCRAQLQAKDKQLQAERALNAKLQARVEEVEQLTIDYLRDIGFDYAPATKRPHEDECASDSSSSDDTSSGGGSSPDSRSSKRARTAPEPPGKP
jgi:hypothetical protein